MEMINNQDIIPVPVSNENFNIEYIQKTRANAFRQGELTDGKRICRVGI